MLRVDFTSLLIIDCKNTIWESNPPANQTSEIIRVDLAVIDTEKNLIVDNEIIHIQPTKSKVSDYCKLQYGIDPEKVYKGLSFKEAYRRLRIHYMFRDHIWASWGTLDKDWLEKEFKRHSLETLFVHNHIDIQYLYSFMTGQEHLSSIDNALRSIDCKPNENTAVNIAHVYMRMANGVRMITAPKTRILVRNMTNSN